MIQILDFVKQIGQLQLADAKVIVDATLGNGHDTLWLKQGAKDAFLYGFDIQKEAIEHTRNRLLDADVDMANIQLIHDSHVHLDSYVDGTIDLLLFNFGYLPGGDKAIVTQTETSLVAIVKGLAMLSNRGVAILVVYPGHEEGAREQMKIEEMLQNLTWSDYRVYCYHIVNNTKKPPIAYIIQKAERKRK